MALQVKPRQHKDGRVYRLAVVIDHGKDKKTGKSNREYIYPKVAEYHTYGFDPMWPLQKARERLKQVQAQDKVERINNRKAKAQARIRERKLVDSAYLPEKLCREFEVFLSRKIGFGDGRLPSRIDSHWLGAQKMICEVQTEPKDYEEYSERFYQYVIKHKYSPSYLQKMLRIVNYWGYFVCRHQKQAFLPVRWPQGIWKERIADAYFDQRPHGLESAPLLPNELEKARSSLLTPAYNWLFISVWLGLRPSEIDALTDKKKMKNWRIEKDKQGITILRVYQPKLVSIEREKRWKGIPILFDQQVQALDFIPLRIDYAVNHIDGNKQNNTPSNLELITHSENMLHCWRVLGHVPMKPKSKIDQETAEQIRNMYAGGASNRALRVKYGLAKATISYIVNLKTWR